MRVLTLVVAALSIPSIAGAQAIDSRWSPWLGCWELVLESAGDRAMRPAPSARELPARPRSATSPRVCVEPAADGATFSTRVATQTPIEQTVIADGTDRPIEDGDCRGTSRTGWSQDGRRLFSRADLTCESDKGRRRVSGLAVLGPGGTWLDIQAVDISGQETVRVRRYRRVSGDQPAGYRPQARLTIEDVKEASTKLSPTALEAALIETGSTFTLSGKELIALQEAGVPSRVTDLMIALSYPDRFVVERTARADRAPAVPFVDDPFFLGWAFGYPMWSDLYGFYSPLYGSYSPYFYSPFSYSYLRGYDPRYFGGGSFFAIDDGGGSAPSRPSGAGRVVDGRGYTRVRSREAGTTSSGQTAGAGSAPSSSGGSSSSSSGGGGSVSTQGFSSGGSGGDGGRTAQPR